LIGSRIVKQEPSPSLLWASMLPPCRSRRDNRSAQCRPRRGCLATHCGRREHLNDDFHVVTLSNELLAAPPIGLWHKHCAARYGSA
jgi:hypothetical protein